MPIDILNEMPNKLVVCGKHCWS